MNNDFFNNERIAIIVMGRTASGKTTTAKRLAEMINFKYVSCAYYKRLIKNNYDKNDSLNDKLRDEGLKLALDDTIEAIKEGKNIIIDSSFGLLKRRQYAVDYLDKYVNSIFFVYCKTTNIVETKNRIECRKGKETEDIQFHASDFNIYEHINYTFEEPSISELENIEGSKYIFYIDTFKKEICTVKNGSDGLTNYLYRMLKYCIE